jgi:hypothetical protein
VIAFLLLLGPFYSFSQRVLSSPFSRWFRSLVVFIPRSIHNVSGSLIETRTKQKNRRINIEKLQKDVFLIVLRNDAFEKGV